MSNHNWKIKEIDSGHLGINEFWDCTECGASAGPVRYDKGEPTPHKEPMYPFWPNGTGLKLRMDCQESKRLIKAFKLGYYKGTGSKKEWENI